MKVNGIVDDEFRALIDVSVGARKRRKMELIRVWIDTAFNGGLFCIRSIPAANANNSIQLLTA